MPNGGLIGKETVINNIGPAGRVTSFNSSGTFTTFLNGGSADILVVAGGGGGGHDIGGGGGGGGYRTASSHPLPANPAPIIIRSYISILLFIKIPLFKKFYDIQIVISIDFY